MDSRDCIYMYIYVTITTKEKEVMNLRGSKEAGWGWLERLRKGK